MAQLGARLDGIEEVVGSNPIGSTKFIIPFSVCILQDEITRVPVKPGRSWVSISAPIKTPAFRFT